MYTAEQDPKDTNSGNDGFIWSRGLTIVAGMVLALALAAVRLAPAFAVPIEWLP
jgi:hypothetical protein